MTRGGLYPKELVLNDTTVSDEHVQFLGMDLKGCGNRFHIDVYDKRKSFPFVVTRYPHMDSLIPRTIPYGVLVGQLHRVYRICTEWENFVDSAVDVAWALAKNGCHKGRLCKLFHVFVHKHVTKFKVGAKALTQRFQTRLGSS